MSKPRKQSPVVQAELIAEFPCTQTQQRCWFLDQLGPGNTALNVAVRWEICGAFKTQVIEEAFRKVIERHEILRTRFVAVDGAPVQQVVSAVEFHMPVIDLRNAPRPVEDRVQAIAVETASASFDLTQPCQFRVTFVQTENDRGFILITAHQICFDGWSIRVLGREFGEFAAAIAEERAPRLEPLPLQYGDFALWQSEFLNSYGFDQERKFWVKQLGGAPYFEVKPDRPRQAAKTNNGDIVSVAAVEPFGSRIDKAARDRKMSLYAFGAAVVSAMLHRLTGSDCILIGTQVAGRDDVDLEGLIGVFINNVVLRFDMDPAGDFASHFERAGALVEETLNNQKMPFNKLVEAINPPRDAARNPIISVNFNLQKAFLENATYGGFELISAASQSPGVIYDLNFIMIGRPGNWRLSVEYNTDLFDKVTAEAILKLWQDTYELVLDRADARIADTPSLPGRRTSDAIVKKVVVTDEFKALDEIIGRHPDIESSVSFADGGSGLVSFVSPRPGYAGAVEGLPASVLGHLRDSGAPLMPSKVGVVVVPPSDGSAVIPLARDQIEDAVSAIWSNLLGVAEIHPDDDFFALGGHSLLALRMLAAVEARFGVRPNLAALFKAPTLQAFASGLTPQRETAVAAPEKTAWDCAVYTEGKTPFTLVTLNHPLLFHHVAARLADGPRVINANLLNAPDLAELGGKSFDDIVGEAADLVEREAPEGPIGIVGLCINGTLALALGAKLAARGREPKIVGMIDSWAPNFYSTLSDATRRRWNTKRRIKRLAYFTKKLVTGNMPLSRFVAEFSAPRRMLIRAGLMSPPSRHEVDTEAITDILVQASRKAEWQPYAGQVMMYRSKAQHAQARQLRFGWGGRIAGSCAVADLGGWHEDSLTEAGVRDLAASLQELMAEK